MKFKFLILTNREDLNKTWEENLVDRTALARNFKKAYHLSLFLASIAIPNLEYRQALYILNKKGAVKIEGNSEWFAFIIKTREYV